MKKIIQVVLSIILFIILVVGGYVAYVYLQYHRLPDNIALKVEKSKESIKVPEVETKKELSIMTFNIGYGSYPPDYTFFMDGGKEVRARSVKSVKSVKSAINTDINLVKASNPDFVNIQEIDWDGDRSQHVDQPKMMKDSLVDYQSVLAQNYDSAYLFYPVTNPIGKAKSGIMTFSKYKIDAARRYKLPIETNFNKFFDLDRAFSVNELSIKDSDKKLIIINTHLSAYTKDVSVQDAQFEKLFAKVNQYSKNGDYVIVGGDYNHALAGKIHNELTWMKKFPTDKLPTGMRVVAPTNTETVRSNGVTLDDPKEIKVIIDGFLVSDNIESISIQTIDNGFKSSDHQPVIMKFSLN